jgi:hypothetical protein
MRVLRSISELAELPGPLFLAPPPWQLGLRQRVYKSAAVDFINGGKTNL